MTTDELIAEAALNRTKDPPSEMSPKRTAEGLRLLLEIVLESFEYEKERISTPAMICRGLAGMIDSIEYGLPRKH